MAGERQNDRGRDEREVRDWEVVVENGERDVSWRPTLRGKRSGLPGVPWETDPDAESEFHLRRTKD